jgi:hypothetical protein
MRQLLAGWERSGLTLREFGEKRRISPSTLSWWRRVFQDAGAEDGNGAAAENAVMFAEVRPPVPMGAIAPDVLRKVGHSISACV